VIKSYNLIGLKNWSGNEAIQTYTLKVGSWLIYNLLT
jgi:hypothetical protein